MDYDEEDDIEGPNGPNNTYKCIVCDRIFDSRKQQQNHERTRSHIQAVERLKNEEEKRKKEELRVYE